MGAMRDKLRATALSTKQRRAEIVEFEGLEYEVRELTLGEQESVRASYLTETGKTRSNGAPEIKVDSLKLQLATIVASTYEPGTEDKVFDPADFDGLKTQPAGGLVAALYKAARNLSGEAEAKNLPATADAK